MILKANAKAQALREFAKHTANVRRSNIAAMNCDGLEQHAIDALLIAFDESVEQARRDLLKKLGIADDQCRSIN